MTDEEFEQLKQDILDAKKKLNDLQKEYKSQTGRFYHGI